MLLWGVIVVVAALALMYDAVRRPANVPTPSGPTGGASRGQVPTAEGLPPSFQGGERYDFHVVGESFYQRVLERAVGGAVETKVRAEVTATLSLDDSNSEDPKAVEVQVDGRTVGYLDRESAREYRRALRGFDLGDGDRSCRAIIAGGGYDADGDRRQLGIFLDLVIPSPPPKPRAKKGRPPT